MAALDNFSPEQPSVNGPYPNAVAITTSDTTDLTNVTRAIYVGGAGAVAIIDMNGNTTTFSAVPVGTVLPVRATRVKTTNTTATLLVALW